MTKEELQDACVPLSIAVKLKDKGFDKPCVALFINGRFVISQTQFINSQTIVKSAKAAPLYEHVIMWFSEKYGIDIFESLEKKVAIDNSKNGKEKLIEVLEESLRLI